MATVVLARKCAEQLGTTPALQSGGHPLELGISLDTRLWLKIVASELLILALEPNKNRFLHIGIQLLRLNQFDGTNVLCLLISELCAPSAFA
jgi:hypothetical protein